MTVVLQLMQYIDVIVLPDQKHTLSDPDISLGGHEAPRSSAKGARIEALSRGAVSSSPLGVSISEY